MSWSVPLNTDLRLLIDEDLEDSVADKIKSISAFNVECVRDFVTLKGKSDKEVMVYAKENNRIILTMDGGFNKTNYPICTHPGIIHIDSRCKHHQTVGELISKFARGGHRIESKHAITHLTMDSYQIEKLQETVLYEY